ncbi:hypothetical protein HYV50_04355 [Candidatus Pacearchaeota archaeon]|nr:hypothetical protein [Candidatus Pacearchaeota archaeon]
MKKGENIVNSGNWDKFLSRISVADNSPKTTPIKRIIHNNFKLVAMLFLIIAFSVLLSVNSPAEEPSVLSNFPNYSPEFNNITKEFFICENSAFSYNLSASDINKEDSLYADISPKNPLFLKILKETPAFLTAEIFSGKINKDEAGKNYQVTVSVSDGKSIAAEKLNINTIEINNPPQLENIGAQTISFDRTKNFNKEIIANDTEHDFSGEGKLNFSLSFLSGREIFNINQFGKINFTANQSHLGKYKIKLCVSDSGIKNVHEKISLCNSDGSAKSNCTEFELAIIEKNKAPTILSAFPLQRNFNISGNETLFFNISKFDPEGIIPDSYWYVDDVLKKYDKGYIEEGFNFLFTCDTSGKHKIKVEITDGLLSDSITWEFNVKKVSCLPEDYFICSPVWSCLDWNLCQNAMQSNKVGILSNLDYDKIKQNCQNNSWSDETCGFQIRSCSDIKECTQIFSYKRPTEIQECYFSLNPSCSDNVKNCHSGSCETLPDCGGPCEPCPTCTDGIKNQGEERIDCGLPCAKQCPLLPPAFYEKENIKKAIVILVIILIPILIIKIWHVVKMRKIIFSNLIKSKEIKS